MRRPKVPSGYDRAGQRGGSFGGATSVLRVGGVVMQLSCLAGGKRDLLLCVTASRRLCRGVPARATEPACVSYRAACNEDCALWPDVRVLWTASRAQAHDSIDGFGGRWTPRST